MKFLKVYWVLTGTWIYLLPLNLKFFFFSQDDDERLRVLIEDSFQQDMDGSEEEEEKGIYPGNQSAPEARN